jgi:polysaccharide export outer membrane protein
MSRQGYKLCFAATPKPNVKETAMNRTIVLLPTPANRIHRLAVSMLAVIVLGFITGCQSPSMALLDAPAQPSPAPNPASHSQVEAIQNNPKINEAISQAVSQAEATDTNQVVTLREGDILKISFAGSPSLNTIQTIRNDGVISMPLVGEVKAAGLTPNELDQKLIELYASQLTTKEVTVEVQSSAYPVYVTGAVLRPGKILSSHSITALEAVMEAGGFDYTKADMKHVVVIRKEAGGTKNYVLDLKAVMDGKTGTPFYLKPSDIILVKEKMVWF